MIEHTIERERNRIIGVSGKGCDGKVVAENNFTLVIRWKRPPLGITSTMTVFNLSRIDKNGDHMYHTLISWGQKTIKRRKHGRS